MPRKTDSRLLSESAIRPHIAVLRAFPGDAREEGLLRTNAAEGGRVVVPERDAGAVTVDGTMPPPRPPVACLAATLVLATAACGAEDAPERDVGLGGPTPTTLTPSQPAAPDLPSVDGFLLSATETEVVVRSQDGERTFPVKPEDRPKLGLEHLGSHAGLTDVGFRVYYRDEGGRRFIKYATEIPPPFAPAGT